MGKEYNRKDHLYQRAKQEGYRSRAAYKLLEVDKKHRLFRPGARVADLGCFPGGWLQVAAAAVGEKGVVVGIDLKPVESLPEPQIHIVQADFTEPGIDERLTALAGGKFNAIISDLSPAISGIRLRDALRSAELVEQAFHFAANGGLTPGGHFLAKIFPGQECEEVAKEIKPRFTRFLRLNLDSTRRSSNELYFLGYQFISS